MDTKPGGAATTSRMKFTARAALSAVTGSCPGSEPGLTASSQRIEGSPSISTVQFGWSTSWR